MPTTTTTYSNYLTNPNPNTQPIYPRVPISWRVRLTNQVTALDLSGGTEKPVFLGSASESGCILETWTLSSLVTNPGGGGGSGSDPGADGTYGLGTALDPLKIRYYTKPFGEEKYYLVYELGTGQIDPEQRFSIGRMGFPILPSPQTAWRLAPLEELYVSLNKAIVSPGLDFFVYGGQYS